MSEDYVKLDENTVLIDFATLSKLIVKDLTSTEGAELLKKYPKESILKFMDNPQKFEKELRSVSIALYNASSHYRRLIKYFADMLTLDYIVAPWGSSVINNYNPTTLKSAYIKALDYVETMNIKHEFRKILTVALREDIFYGYHHVNGNSSFIQRFEPDYCQISSIEDGIYNFAFDMSYFDGKNNSKLVMYPKEFTKMYNAYLKDKKNGKWQEVDSNASICIKINEDLKYCLPVFCGVFLDLFDLNEYKNLKKTKTKIGNFKFITQEIPVRKDSMNNNDFAITLDVAKQFHNNISSTTPDEIGVITTPMKLSQINLDDNGSTNDKVAEAESNFWSNAGVAKDLFNGNNASGTTLAKSVQVDESAMFDVLRQVERLINRKLRSIGGSRFKIVMPEITVYNRSDVFDMHLKAKQFGVGSSMMIGACLGYSPSDMMNMNILENEILGLPDMLVPLQSSHTQNDGNGATDSGGSPKKKDSQISSEGDKTRDSNKNGS